MLFLLLLNLCWGSPVYVSIWIRFYCLGSQVVIAFPSLCPGWWPAGCCKRVKWPLQPGGGFRVLGFTSEKRQCLLTLVSLLPWQHFPLKENKNSLKFHVKYHSWVLLCSSVFFVIFFGWTIKLLDFPCADILTCVISSFSVLLKSMCALYGF